MEERVCRGDRGLNKTPLLYRMPNDVRTILWEEEDRVYLHAYIRELEQHETRMRGDFVEVTEAELISHLIGLIDLGKEDNAIIIEQSDDTFVVNPKFRLRFENYDKPVDTYILPFLKPRKQLRAISQFVGKTLNSPTASILQEYCVKFLSEHADAVKQRYTTTTVGLQTLFLSLYDLLQPLTVTYNILSMVIAVNSWNFASVECFLERFLRMMTYVELQSEETQCVVGKLQRLFYPLFGRYFNFIFKNGFVESVYTEEFLFYNVNKNNLLTLDVRVPISFLWSREFVDNVLNGARDARRLQVGRKDYKLCSFSQYFQGNCLYESLPIMTCQAFQRKLYTAAALCARDNARQLSFFLKENRKLEILLDEIEQVYSGFALRDLAYDLFGADRPSSNCDVSASFYDSLCSSGFNSESCERWTVSCCTGYLEDLVIKPKLDWPLFYIIDDKIIDTFNKCLRFLLQLIRASELLSRIRIHYTNVDKIGLNTRKFNFLLCVISQPLTVMAELFFTHLSSLMSKKLPLILNSKTVEEAQEHATSLNDLMYSFVMKEGARKLIHEAVVKLWSMCDEICYRLKTESMKPSDLENLLKVALREKKLLVGIGKGMEGTFFMALQLFLP